VKAHCYPLTDLLFYVNIVGTFRETSNLSFYLFTLPKNEKQKTFSSFAASAALIANLALGVASAETTTSDQQLNGGSLTIVSVPASVDFDTINVSTSSTQNISTFNSNSVHIKDTRSTSSNFSFTVVATDFEETSNLTTFDVTTFAIDADAGGAVNAVGSSDCTSGITLLNTGTIVTFVDADNNGTSGAEAMLSGDTRIRVMECQMTPHIRVIVPGSTAAGTYRSTFVWAIA
jgi:hypothetical protein